MSKRKGRYATLPHRDLVQVQVAHLKFRFELAQESFLGRQVVSLTNQCLEEYEKEQGALRAEPGKLLVRVGENDLLLPLMTAKWAEELAQGLSSRTAKRHLELEQYLLLQAADQSATLEAAWRFCNQAELTHKSAPRGFSFLPEEPLNTEKLIHPPLKPQAAVPPNVLEKLLAIMDSDYGTRPGLAEAMIKAAAEIRSWCCPLVKELEPGQVVWLVHGTRKTKRSDPRLFTPVVLTILSPAEQNLVLDHRGAVKKLKMAQIERVTAEAWRQGGVLTTVDIEWLLSVSSSMMRELLETYQEEFGILLPTAGTVLDMGRTLTHKALVIDQFLQGLTAAVIAERIFHTEEAVDAYIKTFDRLLILKLFGMSEQLMHRVTGHSLAMIKEHLALAEKHFPTKESLMEYLGQRNISLDNTG